MPHRAPRILTLLLATAGACLAATGADAQSSGRYLSWANRPADTTPADVVAAQTRARDMIPRRVAPSQGFNRPVMQAPASNIAVSHGLTPASAWIGPRVTPAYAPGSPDPIGDATQMTAAPAYAPAPAQIQRAAVDPMAPRRDAPVYNLPRQPQAAAPVQPVPQALPIQQAPARQAAADTAADPMAPRRDAPIFQMQQGQPQAQPQPEQQAALPPAGQATPSSQSSVQSGQSGARYYSVHRDAGHRPDPTALPEPVYFDSVTVDLAEPPTDELPARNAQGRRRVVPNDDPSLP